MRILMVVCLLMLSGCAPLIVVTVGTVSVVASQEGGLDF
jgi:hypothetical protein